MTPIINLEASLRSNSNYESENRTSSKEPDSFIVDWTVDLCPWTILVASASRAFSLHYNLQKYKCTIFGIKISTKVQFHNSWNSSNAIKYKIHCINYLQKTVSPYNQINYLLDLTNLVVMSPKWQSSSICFILTKDKIKGNV